MHAMSISRLSLLAAVALSLTACGGGGSSTTEADQTTTPATTGETGGGTTTTADAIDKYIGTFVSTACTQMTDVLNASTGAPLFEKKTITVETKLAANSAQVKYLHQFYDSNACTGNPASLTVSGSANTLTIDGTTTVSQGTADKVTLAEGNKLPGISAGKITIGATQYVNGYTLPKDMKTLMLLTGQDLFTGNATAVLDTQGYPSALAASASYKKQ